MLIYISTIHDHDCLILQFAIFLAMFIQYCLTLSSIRRGNKWINLTQKLKIYFILKSTMITPVTTLLALSFLQFLVFCLASSPEFDGYAVGQIHIAQVIDQLNYRNSFS